MPRFCRTFPCAAPAIERLRPACNVSKPALTSLDNSFADQDCVSRSGGNPPRLRLDIPGRSSGIPTGEIAVAQARRAETGSFVTFALPALAQLGREPISVRSPPMPRDVMSARVTGISAKTRCRIQLKPFSFGDRAQPGAPITGVPSIDPRRSEFPGSTGIPKCSTRPSRWPME